MSRFRQPLSCVMFLIVPIMIQAQTSSPNLTAGVAEVNAGHYLDAVLLLNDAVKETQGRELARVHAFRALAFLNLKQGERAEAAVALSLIADPGLPITATEFTLPVVRLFDAARALNPAALDRAASTAPPPPKPTLPPMSPPNVPPAIGVAEVHIFWPPQLAMAGNSRLECDGTRIAELSKQRFVVVSVSAGTHSLRFRKRSHSFTFEGGETYFVRASAKYYPVVGYLGVLTLTSAAEALREIREEGVTLNDRRDTYAVLCGPAAKPRRGQ